MNFSNSQLLVARLIYTCFLL